MLIEIQAAEREATGEQIEVRFYGEIFGIDRMNQFALMKMAGAQADGEMAIMSAFWGFLKSLIVPDDWDRFEKLCMAKRCGLEELQPLIEGIAENMTARPTPRPSDLPTGEPVTTPRSRVVSLTPATPTRSA